MGQVPSTHGVSLRTFNRNFEGRSGSLDAQGYLVSPEVAAASAIKGVITDPRKLGKAPAVELPEMFLVEDHIIIPPLSVQEAAAVEIIRGPNIKSLPRKGPLPPKLTGFALIKLGDNITTDHIISAGAKVLPLRSNVPAISEHTFERVDASFVKRAKEMGGSSWEASIMDGGRAGSTRP